MLGKDKKNTDHEYIGADPGKKDASATPFLPAVWRICTYHFDTDPDPGYHGFITRKIFKIWFKKTLISHVLFVYIT